MLHKLGDVFAEEGEGWVGDHNVRLLEQLNAFSAAKIAALLEGCSGVWVPLQKELDVFDAGRAVSVEIRHFLNLDGDRLGLLALAIALEILIERELYAGDGGAIVAGGDELLEAEPVKVGGEVFKEVAFEGVIAVTVDNLATEGVLVEL